MPYLKSSQITGLSPKPLDVTGFTQSDTEILDGTYSQHEVLLADNYNIKGDVTISDNLILAKLSDDGNAITLTGDSTTRTIAGSGSLEGSTFAQTPNASLTGMIGTLDNSVQDNVTRLGTVTTGTFEGTLNSSTTFPAGHILKTTFALCDSSPQISSSTYSDVSGCSLAYTMLSSSNTLMILGMGTVNRGSTDGQSGARITKDGVMLAQVENRDHNDNDRFSIPNVRVAGYSGSATFNLQIRSISNNNKAQMTVGDGYAIMEIQG